MSMIEDAELRELFETESEEYLHMLDAGLLHLETSPNDGGMLEEVFRAAHSLKGSARMLNVTTVETIAHHLEDQLGEARRGRKTLSPEDIDGLCREVDEMRRQVQIAVGKEAAASEIPAYNALQDTAPSRVADPDENEDDEAAERDSASGLQERDIQLQSLKLTAQLNAAPVADAPGDEVARFRIELWSLFESESEEHLDALDAGLMQLETAPNDSTALEGVFHAAHSLKGSARMLGLLTLENIAYSLENELGEVRRGEKPLTAEGIDKLCRQVAEMRGQVQVAVKKEILAASTSSGYSPAAEVGPTLAAGAAVTALATAPPSESEAAGPRAKNFEMVASSQPTAALASESGSGVARFKIDTIRVPPAKLDMLMTLAGELAVTTTRVSRGLNSFDEITALWEAWSRDLQSHGSGYATDRSGQPGQESVANRNRERIERLGVLLAQLRASTIEDVTRLRLVADEIEENVRNVRLLPLDRIFNLFPRPVRDLSRSQGKEVQLIIEGADTEVDKRVLEELKDPLMHMIRNAVDHGIELPAERERAGKNRMATLHLRAIQTAMNVVIELQDDGRGLNTEAIRRVALKRQVVNEEELAVMTREQVESLIFSPGFSTSPLVTDVSGRGVGLDVVRANVEALKGSIHIYSVPGQGCRMRIVVPLTLATTRVLLVEAAGRPYGLPIEFIKGIVSVADTVVSLEGRDTILLEGGPLSVGLLAAFLELPETSRDESQASKSRPCVVLEVGDSQFGLLVDALIDEQEVVLKPLGGVLKRVRHVAGATILGTGEVCHVLNPHDMLRTIQRGGVAPIRSERPAALQARKKILLVEDSITTRTQEKRIMEAAGYEVVTAVDGVDGFNKLSSQTFDAVVSDVEMPNMNGLDLAAKIRLDKRYEELPIILVTSLASEEDKRRGVEVGANAYITKGSFDQKALLDTLGRLA